MKHVSLVLIFALAAFTLASDDSIVPEMELETFEGTPKGSSPLHGLLKTSSGDAKVDPALSKWCEL